MKKLLPFLSLAIITAACNTQVDKNAQPASTQATQQLAQPDTTGLASFNAWKAQNELAQTQPTQQVQTTVAQQPQKVRTIVKRVPVYTPVKTSAPVASDTKTTTETNSGTGDANSGTISNTSSETAKAEKKTGWSKATKGAVIGGVAGAAGGAIINKKNRVVGAVIGGVLGAAGGYGIGKTMDKKDGRIDYAIN